MMVRKARSNRKAYFQSPDRKAISERPGKRGRAMASITARSA